MGRSRERKKKLVEQFMEYFLLCCLSLFSGIIRLLTLKDFSSETCRRKFFKCKNVSAPPQSLPDLLYSKEKLTHTQLSTHIKSDSRHTNGDIQITITIFQWLFWRSVAKKVTVEVTNWTKKHINQPEPNKINMTKPSYPKKAIIDGRSTGVLQWMGWLSLDSMIIWGTDHL